MLNDKGSRPLLSINIDKRILSIIVFSLFSSWFLSFVFEGQVLYAILGRYDLNAHTMVFGSIIAVFAGLFACGLFIKTMPAAKQWMLFSFSLCIAGSSLLLFVPRILWEVLLWSMAFLGGTCVAAWGFFFKQFTPSNERIKTAADCLIFSNILMIGINLVAINYSSHAGLALTILMLVGALLFAAKLPQEVPEEKTAAVADDIEPGSLLKTLAFLYLFIFIITINSGLMYQVINPAFAHHQWLVSWYWAVPYVTALYIMKNLPRETNRTYILYVAIAMMGFAFIAFMTFSRSAPCYLLVNTLMLGVCGVFDLFWWSILGEMLDFDQNPAKILGIGLSANVLGVLLGGVIGKAITTGDLPTYDPAVLALVVVFIILIMLPLLHRQLSRLLKNHAYLTVVSADSPDGQTRVANSTTPFTQLTERENEIAGLLFMGRTYKMIANELFLSENTVKTHIKNLYSKLNINSKSELINLMLGKDSSEE